MLETMEIVWVVWFLFCAYIIKYRVERVNSILKQESKINVFMCWSINSNNEQLLIYQTQIMIVADKINYVINSVNALMMYLL